MLLAGWWAGGLSLKPGFSCVTGLEAASEVRPVSLERKGEGSIPASFFVHLPP